MQHAFTPAGLPTLPTGDAAEVANILQDRLIDVIDLGLSLKHAHWNVVGPGFMPAHELFDSQADTARRMADEIAERIATFGAIPNGLPEFMVSRRHWDDYSLGWGVSSAHIGALDRVFNRVIAAHRFAITQIAPIDPVTADLLTAQARALEKQQSSLRAHLSNTSGKLPTEHAVTQLAAACAAATADPLS